MFHHDIKTERKSKRNYCMKHWPQPHWTASGWTERECWLWTRPPDPTSVPDLSNNHVAKRQGGENTHVHISKFSGKSSQKSGAYYNGMKGINIDGMFQSHIRVMVTCPYPGCIVILNVQALSSLLFSLTLMGCPWNLFFFCEKLGLYVEPLILLKNPLEW